MVLALRLWAPVWRNANLSDVLPSKCYISGQRFCSAAISLKSTGSIADMAATDPVVVWFGQTKNEQHHFSKKYNSCTLNSEMNAKWHCCLGEMGAEMQEMAVTSGLWSVQSWNLNLRKNGGNVWFAAWAANNLRSKKLSNMIACLWVCGKRTQVAANGSWF